MTQEPCGITFQMVVRREKRLQRTRGRSGTAADLQERYAICRAPERGMGVAGIRGTGRAQWRRGLSCCTDRSAGGGADRHTTTTVGARACGGREAAEATPRRCTSWRRRGRGWRGPAARATTRPCRLSAGETGLLTAARPEVAGTPRGRKPRPPTAACPTGCPHGLGKRGRTDRRTAAIRGA